MNTPGHVCRLYLVTPPRLDPAAFAPLLAAALDGGDVACVQLRLKDVGDAAILAACEALIPIAREREVAFLVNDRPDLAASAGADGVHVGQDDVGYAEARAAVGDDAIVGVTCHDSRHLAIAAAAAGADYVAFGAFFPTGTKEAKSAANTEVLRWWHEIATVPSVAIGGITVGNCGSLVEAGADYLAVVAGVWDDANGPAQAVRDFNTEIEKMRSRAGQ